MPIVTPYEMRLRRAMQAYLPQAEAKVLIHGERYEVHFRFPDEPENDGYPHWFKGSFKQVRAAIEEYAEELTAAATEESADAPIGTT